MEPLQNSISSTIISSQEKNSEDAGDRDCWDTHEESEEELIESSEDEGQLEEKKMTDNKHQKGWKRYIVARREIDNA